MFCLMLAVISRLLFKLSCSINSGFGIIGRFWIILLNGPSSRSEVRSKNTYVSSSGLEPVSVRTMLSFRLISSFFPADCAESVETSCVINIILVPLHHFLWYRSRWNHLWTQSAEDLLDRVNFTDTLHLHYVPRQFGMKLSLLFCKCLRLYPNRS